MKHSIFGTMENQTVNTKYLYFLKKYTFYFQLNLGMTDILANNLLTTL